MHTLTIVLLPAGAGDLWRASSELLERHRLDWDDVGRPSRLDYWTVGGGALADEITAVELGVVDNPDLARNVCFVSRLRVDFVPGAVVTPDGRWHDLADHGWRLRDGDSRANRAAQARWAAHVRELLAAHAGCVAVEFDTHS